MTATSGLQRQEEWLFRWESPLLVFLRCCHIYVFITCVHSPSYCCREIPLYDIIQNSTVYFSILLLRNIRAFYFLITKRMLLPTVLKRISWCTSSVLDTKYPCPIPEDEIRMSRDEVLKFIKIRLFILSK